jgi:hypothetical protein
MEYEPWLSPARQPAMVAAALFANEVARKRA